MDSQDHQVTVSHLAHAITQSNAYTDSLLAALRAELNASGADDAKTDTRKRGVKLALHLGWLTLSAVTAALMIAMHASPYLAVTVPSLPLGMLEAVDRWRRL